MPEIPEESYVDPNPEIKNYSKKDGMLEIETTHKDPVVNTKSYNIGQMQAKIAKIQGVIDLWEAKKAPYQAIIDKYNSL